MWLHVDACHAGTAAMLPEHASILEGVAEAGHIRTAESHVARTWSLLRETLRSVERQGHPASP